MWRSGPSICRPLENDCGLELVFEFEFKLVLEIVFGIRIELRFEIELGFAFKREIYCD